MTIVRVRVGDVLRLERRPVAPEPLQDYIEVGVRSFGKGIFHKEPVPGADLGNKRVFRIAPDDLVISNVFAWEGAIAVASLNESGTIGSHRFMTFRPTDGRIDTRWAAWFLRSEPGLELLGNASPGSAGRNRTLAIDRFEALEIPLPSVEEQRLVAQRLDNIQESSDELRKRRSRSETLNSALPFAAAREAEQSVARRPTSLGEVLELVREPLEVDPASPYVTVGIRSFGRGLFHYPERRGAEIGKLRFYRVRPGLLAVSNIKAWEGAVATTCSRDEGTVASNRFLFFRPLAGEDATDYFWARLLDPDGIAALGQASPGSADRNRTLAIERFNAIVLKLPSMEDQAAIGRHVAAVRAAVSEVGNATAKMSERIDALVLAAMNEAFDGLS